MLRVHTSSGIVFLFILIITLLFGFFVGGYCVKYDVEFWASYIKHTQVIVPFIPCGIAGLVLFEIAVPVAVITWVLSYII